MKTLSVAVKIISQGGAKLKSDLLGLSQPLTRLQETTKRLANEQRKLGAEIKRAANPAALRGLQTQYDRLTADIKRATDAQKKFSDLQAKSQAANERAGQFASTSRSFAVASAATAAPVVAGAISASRFESLLRDIAITGDFGRTEESELGRQIVASSTQYKIGAMDLGESVRTLVAAGIQSPDRLGLYVPQIAKTAVAANADPRDLASTAASISQTLHVADKEMEKAFAGLVLSTKFGRFEFLEIARNLPNIAPMFESLGMTGTKAVAELGAALQVAKIGAGTPDIAANNLVNFLQKISSPDTARDFEKAGIDFDKSKATLVARGMSPIEATLRIIDDYMKRQEPQTRKLFAAAINAKTPDDQKAAAEAIGRSSALGVLFQDIQAMGFIRSALPNMGMYKDIRQKAMTPGDVIDKDFANRIDQATFAWTDFKNAVWAASVTLGQAVLPALTAIGRFIVPIIRGATSLAATFPRATAVIAIGVPVILGAVAAVAALGYAAFGLMAGTLALQSFGAIIGGVTVIPALIKSATLALWGLRFAAIGIGTAAAPILIVGAAIAGAAYLIYRNWDTIKAALQGAWEWIVSLGSRMYDAGANLFKRLADGMKSMLPDVSGMFGKVGSFFGMTMPKPPPAGGSTPASRIGALQDRIGAVQPALKPGNQMTVTYAPSVTVQGGAGAGEDVAKVLENDRRRFAEQMRRHQADQARVAY